jgi:hypothetical protein
VFSIYIFKEIFSANTQLFDFEQKMDLVYSSDSDIEDFLVLETVPKPRTARQVSLLFFLTNTTLERWLDSLNKVI